MLTNQIVCSQDQIQSNRQWICSLGAEPGRLDSFATEVTGGDMLLDDQKHAGPGKGWCRVQAALPFYTSYWKTLGNSGKCHLRFSERMRPSLFGLTDLVFFPCIRRQTLNVTLKKKNQSTRQKKCLWGKPALFVCLVGILILGFSDFYHFSWSSPEEVLGSQFIIPGEWGALRVAFLSRGYIRIYFTFGLGALLLSYSGI